MMVLLVSVAWVFSAITDYTIQDSLTHVRYGTFHLSPLLFSSGADCTQTN